MLMQLKWSFLFLTLSLAQNNSRINDSVIVDVFPLAIGNQWEYSYDYEYRDINAILNDYSDTGTVIIKIYDMISTADSTRWLVEEIGTHWTKWNNSSWSGPQSRVDSFEIIEFQTGNHFMYRSGDPSKVRISVVPFLRILVDTSKISRYSLVDAMGNKVINSRDSLSPNTFQFKFSKSIGLSNVHMSYACSCLPYYWAQHALRNSIITGVKGSTNIVENLEHQLHQNYPNPFNPSTSFSFTIPNKSFVSLKVFDIVGREVATIISEELQPGTYSRVWNPSLIVSGVYFYRLQADNYSETRKLLLLK